MDQPIVTCRHQSQDKVPSIYKRTCIHTCMAHYAKPKIHARTDIHARTHTITSTHDLLSSSFRLWLRNISAPPRSPHQLASSPQLHVIAFVVATQESGSGHACRRASDKERERTDRRRVLPFCDFSCISRLNVGGRVLKFERFFASASFCWVNDVGSIPH